MKDWYYFFSGIVLTFFDTGITVSGVVLFWVLLKEIPYRLIIKIPIALLAGGFLVFIGCLVFVLAFGFFKDWRDERR